MSSYSEGQIHQLADQMEAAGLTPKHVTKLGQSFELLLNFRRVLDGEATITMVEGVPRDPDSFFRTRKGLWVDDNFRSLVVAKAKTSVTVPAFKYVGLTRDMNDAEIEKMLGDDHLFTETEACALIMDLITKQEGGVEGELLNNGYSNLLYLPSCVVRVDWLADDREWRVNAWRRDGNGGGTPAAGCSLPPTDALSLGTMALGPFDTLSLGPGVISYV